VSATVPRVVLVTRKTEYELLLERHATRQQARFFLSSRGQSLEQVEERHQQQLSTVHEVVQGLPTSWRRSRVERGDLARFLFEPDDTVIVVGQDGLVANAAKYLDGQPVLGVNPDPHRFDGVLVPLDAGTALRLVSAAVERAAATEHRTMVQATLDDGQELLALNELFLGHRSHQSARYSLHLDGRSERQSSSGILITTGTGATGWARSVTRERRETVPLPAPEEDRLAFFVREAFPSVSTGTTLTQGSLAEGEALRVTSEMNEGGVLFGDGIEMDHVRFDWGATVTVATAVRHLQLVHDD